MLATEHDFLIKQIVAAALEKKWSYRSYYDVFLFVGPYYCCAWRQLTKCTLTLSANASSLKPVRSFSAVPTYWLYVHPLPTRWRVICDLAWLYFCWGWVGLGSGGGGRSTGCQLESGRHFLGTISPCQRSLRLLAGERIFGSFDRFGSLAEGAKTFRSTVSSIGLWSNLYSSRYSLCTSQSLSLYWTLFLLSEVPKGLT